MAEKINKRIKEVAAKKAQQDTVNPYAKLPALGKPESIFWLFWAFTLDMMGLLCAILILAFGAGVVLSFVVDFMAMVTIVPYMYFKTKQLPAGKRFSRLAKRSGAVSFVELFPVAGDLIPSWTIYLFFEFRKGEA